MRELVDKLRRRGFDAHLFVNAAEAAEYARGIVREGCTVGIGGSVTVRDIGLAEQLRLGGHEVYWHWEAVGDEVNRVRSDAARADIYLCSANAITKDGVIFNTDGYGNRLAATLYGPKEVFFFIGRNKVCEDFDAAYRRIKDVATPLNAKRLGTKTPCAVTGKCENCMSPHTMCCATLFFERPTGGRVMHVLMIDEDLGY